MAYRSKKEICKLCSGSGKHISGGKCFQCNGKGYMNNHDKLRHARYVVNKANKPLKPCLPPVQYKDD